MALPQEDKFGARKVYLNSSNSVMNPTAAQTAPVGGVGARGAVVQPPTMARSLNEAMFGAKEATPAPAVTQPVVAQPAPAVAQPAPLAPENAAVNAPASSIGARPAVASANGTEQIPVGSGVVIDNSTGQAIQVGNGQARGVRTQVASAPATPVDPYAEAALREVANSDALMNAEIRGTKMTNRGQILTEGSQAVGNGIVARGALNRAKILSDISNSNNTVQIGARNSNVNAANVNSMIEDRGLDNTRQDQVTSLGARKGNLEIGQLEQLTQLQDQYLKETDPTKRQAITEQLAALTGKTTEKYQPIMGKDELGNPIYLGAFNARTGEATNTGPKTASNTAPAAALDFLKKNPNQADAFKAKYGYLPAGF